MSDDFYNYDLWKTRSDRDEYPDDGQGRPTKLTALDRQLIAEALAAKDRPT